MIGSRRCCQPVSVPQDGERDDLDARQLQLTIAIIPRYSLAAEGSILGGGPDRPGFGHDCSILRLFGEGAPVSWSNSGAFLSPVSGGGVTIIAKY